MFVNSEEHNNDVNKRLQVSAKKAFIRNAEIRLYNLPLFGV
jgi:hypothetical protein